MRLRPAAPDLVIADFSFDDGLGLGLAAEIRARYPHLPVLLMSIDDATRCRERASLAGARGCVSKQELDGTALTPIRAALDGES